MPSAEASRKNLQKGRDRLKTIMELGKKAVAGQSDRQDDPDTYKYGEEVSDQEDAKQTPPKVDSDTPAGIGEKPEKEREECKKSPSKTEMKRIERERRKKYERQHGKGKRTSSKRHRREASSSESESESGESDSVSESESSSSDSEEDDRKHSRSTHHKKRSRVMGHGRKKSPAKPRVKRVIVHRRAPAKRRKHGSGVSPAEIKDELSKELSSHMEKLNDNVRKTVERSAAQQAVSRAIGRVFLMK